MSALDILFIWTGRLVWMLVLLVGLIVGGVFVYVGFREMYPRCEDCRKRYWYNHLSLRPYPFKYADDPLPDLAEDENPDLFNSWADVEEEWWAKLCVTCRATRERRMQAHVEVRRAANCRMPEVDA